MRHHLQDLHNLRLRPLEDRFALPPAENLVFVTELRNDVVGAAFGCVCPIKQHAILFPEKFGTSWWAVCWAGLHKQVWHVTDCDCREGFDKPHWRLSAYFENGFDAFRPASKPPSEATQ